MFKKCITLITLIAFVVLTFACSTTKYLSSDSMSEYEGQKIDIRRAEKTTGEIIEFTDSSDWITENSIVGEAIVEKEIDRKNINNITGIYPIKTYSHEIIMKDGEQYMLRSYKELNDQIVLVELDEEIIIPLSEVKEIEISKKENNEVYNDELWGTVFLAGIGGLVALIVIFKYWIFDDYYLF